MTNPALRYALAYKPFGLLCKLRDRHGRQTLADLGLPPALKPVGRLDRDSEGLLLLTSDGQLLHRLTHPRYHHPKTYLVLVLGRPSLETLRALRTGVEIKTGVTQPADVEILSATPPLPPFPTPLPASEKTTWLRIILYEGMNRQLKRMTAAVGHPTVRLARVAVGPLPLPSDLKPGSWRELTETERRLLLGWVWPTGRPASMNPNKG